MVVAFIEEHKARFGLTPICKVLTEHGCKIAPSTDSAARKRQPSARALSDAVVWEKIKALQADPAKGRGMAGYRKMWHLLMREGLHVARCTVARLMAAHGMQGVVRGGKKIITTCPEQSAERPADLVQRDFTAPAPNRLWIVDFTYVPTWSGMVFAAFVTDVYSRRIVGWRTHQAMPTQLRRSQQPLATGLDHFEFSRIHGFQSAWFAVVVCDPIPKNRPLTRPSTSLLRASLPQTPPRPRPPTGSTPPTKPLRTN